MKLNMKEWLKQNWFKFGILIVLFIISGSIYYHFNIYIPNKEYEEKFKNDLDESTNKAIEDMEKRTQKSLLDTCLEEAHYNYNIFINLNGRTDENGSVFATKDVLDQALKQKKLDEESCYKKYQMK